MVSLQDLKWVSAELAIEAGNIIKQEEFVIDNLVDRITDEHKLIGDEIREYEYSGENNGQILYPLIPGRAPVINYIKLCLAHAFHTRGFEPLILLCDSSLHYCTKKRRDGFDEYRCSICKQTGTKLIEAFGYEPTFLSEYIGMSNESLNGLAEDDLLEHSKIDLSKFAKSTARSTLKKNQLDFDDGEDKQLYTDYLIAGYQIENATESLYNDSDISYIIGYHPAYIYDGILLELANKHGVTSTMIMTGQRDRHILVDYYSEDTHLPIYTDPNYTEKELKKPLSDEQKQRLEEFMADRRSGNNVRYDYTADANDELNRDSNVYSVGIFTNLMWDAALAEANVVFKDQYQWLQKTLEILTEIDGIQVILKPHPAEAMRESKQKVGEWLHSEHPNMSEDINLLQPDTDIDTYSIIDYIDTGIVYSTSVGLEMAYNGTPVITSGQSHYRGHGFTIDPEGIREYTDRLSNIQDQRCTYEMQQLAQRYAYLLWIRKHMCFPVFETKSKTEFGSTSALPVTHDQLTMKDADATTIVDKIIRREPVVKELSSSIDDVS
jgi:hypothetical protein